MSGAIATGKQPLTVQPGELKQLLQEFRGDVLKDKNTKLLKSIDELVVELDLKNRKYQNGYKDVTSIEKLSSKDHGHPQHRGPKEFVRRDSILTTLWKTPHLCAVCNLCIALSGLMCIYAAIHYYLDVQRFRRNFDVIVWSFGQLDKVFTTWLAINLSIVFLLYPAFRFWATTRPFVKRKGFYDSFACILFILYEVALLAVPARVMLVYNLPPISSMIVTSEQLRLWMKTYAFVRENISRALKYKPHQDGDIENSRSGPCPQVGKLIYFLFVPTLIYRDKYPRTPCIRWRFVAWNFLGYIGGKLVAYVIIDYLFEAFDKIGTKPIPLVDFVTLLCCSTFAGGFLMLIMFNGIYHCWMNMFAEILRYGDRMFYGDWWNSTTYGRFYRSWNVFVHDWIYSYVYRDMYVVLRRSRTSAMLIVFLLSAIIHEYLLAICFKFVFPLLFLQFVTFGVLLVFITRKSTSNFWNIFLFGSIYQGWGLMIVFYTFEWYSRTNCPRIIDSWLDYFVPRSYHCIVIT